MTDRKDSAKCVEDMSGGVKVNRRQMCQLLAGGPALLGLLENSSSAKEKKTMPKVLLPIGDGSEVLDTMYAYYRIAEDDYEVVVCGPEARHYHLVIHEVPPNSDVPWDITRELPGYHLKATVAFRDVNPSDYVGLYVSGGRAPEYLRYDKDLMRITRHFFETNKPVATLCHGIEILSASGAIKGRTATTIPKCAMDVEQGGAKYVAKPCIVDGNLVSARGKRDLALLLRDFMRILNAKRGS
jgi:protease I